MKTFPQLKRNRGHAKRKHHYQKCQSTRMPAKQSRKQGGSDDYPTA